MKNLKKLAKEIFARSSVSVVEGMLAESFVTGVGKVCAAKVKEGTKEVMSELVGNLPGQNVF